MTPDDLYGGPNADVSWAVVLAPGSEVKILVIETGDPRLGQGMRSRAFNKAEARYIYDPRDPLKPQVFAVFVDGDYLSPLLTDEPFTYEKKLMEDIQTRNRGWILALQTLVKGRKQTNLYEVDPQGNVVRKEVLGRQICVFMDQPRITPEG